MGLFRSTGDNSKANTISDKDWRDLQGRATKANYQRARFGTDEQVRGSRNGAKSLDQARKGNN